MALFKSDKKKTTNVPTITPKAPTLTPPITPTMAPHIPEMPQIPQTSNTMPKPFGKEDTKAISKEINPNAPQKDDPFFVRIDKFNQAKDNFEDISQKLNELERLITKMDELKTKENIEIDDFKKNAQDIKQTITEVDKEIFSKL